MKTNTTKGLTKLDGQMHNDCYVMSFSKYVVRDYEDRRQGWRRKITRGELWPKRRKTKKDRNGGPEKKRSVENTLEEEEEVM